MRIQQASIGMESARTYRSYTVSSQHFEIMDYGAAASRKGKNPKAAEEQTEKQTEKEQGVGEDSLIASRDQLMQRMQARRLNYNLRDSDQDNMEALKEQILKRLFDLLFSRRERTRERMENYYKEASTPNIGKGSSTYFENPAKEAGQVANQNWATPFYRANYVAETYRVEQEETSFQADGIVKTADGREISFGISVTMSRSFEEYLGSQVVMSNFKSVDPLVINFDTPAASISDQSFYFDLDCDGEEEELHGLNAGSGFLALDKNGDGKINDGGELFGPQNGDGFAALAAYDEDGNGWIDEGDSIFEKLRIWTKDEDGRDVLYRLAETGVGALCLQRVKGDFSLTDSDGQTGGIVRSSGVFLYENGGAGTLQHVDLVKFAKEA